MLNNLGCHKNFGIFFHYLQSLHVQSLTQIKNVFACSKHSFWKLERILTLIIGRAKIFELMKKKFTTNLSIFGSTCAFDLENYGFWKYNFNKSCSYLCDRGHECIIYMIWNQFSIKIYSHLTCSVKMDV